MTHDVINMLSTERGRDELVVRSGKNNLNSSKMNNNLKGLGKADGSDTKQNGIKAKGVYNLNVENENEDRFEEDENNRFIESKNTVSLNHRVTSDEIIKNLSEMNINQSNTNLTNTTSHKNKDSKKQSKAIAKEEMPIINTSNNETILSMKLESEALEMKIINGIKSNAENSLFISSQNNYNKLIYASGTNIVETNIDNFQMRFYQGSKASISKISLSNNYLLLASVESGKDPRAYIFDYETGNKLADFQSEVENVSALNFNSDNSLLAIIGVDDHNRTKAIV